MAADLRSALKTLRTSKNDLSPPFPKIQCTTDQEALNHNSNQPQTGLNRTSSSSILFEDFDEYNDEIFKDIDLFNFDDDPIDESSSQNSSHFLSQINKKSKTYKRPLNTNNFKNPMRQFPTLSSVSCTLTTPIQSITTQQMCTLSTTPTSISTRSMTTPTKVVSSAIKPLTTSATIPIGQPLATPISRPLATPIFRPLTTPISQPQTTPISQPSITPISRPLDTPISRPLTTPFSQSLATPISRPLTTPISRPLTTPTIRHNMSLSPKFPGPAGCLPKINSLDELNATPIPIPPSVIATPASTPIIKKIPTKTDSSSTTEFTQIDSPWVIMMNELDLTDPLSSALLNIDIASVSNIAKRQQFINGKVPHLRVLVKTIVPSTRSATAVLTDPSGEILATIHSSVLEEYKTQLVQGCAAILRQLSIFSPSPRKHYLNVTLDNIVRLYPPSQTVPSNSSMIKLTNIEDHYREQQQQNSFTNNDHYQDKPPQSNDQILVSNNNIEDDFDTFFQDVDIGLLDL